MAYAERMYRKQQNFGDIWNWDSYLNQEKSRNHALNCLCKDNKFEPFLANITVPTKDGIDTEIDFPFCDDYDDEKGLLTFFNYFFMIFLPLVVFVYRTIFYILVKLIRFRSKSKEAGVLSFLICLIYTVVYCYIFAIVPVNYIERPVNGGFDLNRPYYV